MFLALALVAMIAGMGLALYILVPYAERKEGD